MRPLPRQLSSNARLHTELVHGALGAPRLFTLRAPRSRNLALGEEPRRFFSVE